MPILTVQRPARTTLSAEVSRSAQLPEKYTAATKALTECTKIDECKDWADKAAALASYAKQAQDDALLKMAMRIQARAMRRCGELLKQIPAANGANQNIQDGAVPKVTRGSAATDAGLSERQRKTALRVASISEHDFEPQIESQDPPTVTALAEQGMRISKRDKNDGISDISQALDRLTDTMFEEEVTKASSAAKPAPPARHHRWDLNARGLTAQVQALACRLSKMPQLDRDYFVVLLTDLIGMDQKGPA